MVSVILPMGSRSDMQRVPELSSQRCVNCFLDVLKEDSKERFVVYGTPGLEKFCQVRSSEYPRGMAVCKDTLYLVAGENVYKISSDGHYRKLGNIDFGGTVATATVDDKVIIVTNPNAFIVRGDTIERINSPSFRYASDVTVMDGWAIFAEANSGRFFCSDLRNPKSFDGLNFATAEYQSDNLVSIVAHDKRLYLFGKHSLEFWYNAGSSGFPFAPVGTRQASIGALSRDAVAKSPVGIFFVGSDFSVYQTEGYKVRRISNYAVENDISLHKDAIFDAFVYQEQGHVFYVVSFGNKTYVYDALVRSWHERSSSGYGRWRGAYGAWVYGKHMVCDTRSATVYMINDKVYTEAGDSIHRLLQSPTINNKNGRAITMSRLELDFGAGSGVSLIENPQAMLSWSDDGGHTFIGEQWRSLGALGQYARRAVWTRLGTFRDRIFRLAVTDPVNFALIRAVAEVSYR